MCHLAIPRCDLDQPGWICRLIPFVEAQWLSGRMPDSRSRGHRHEYPTHIGAVDDDSLWRCYATTNTNIVPLYLCFAINNDLFYLFTTQLPHWNCWMTSTGSWFICARYMTPHLVLLVWSYQKWKCGFLHLFFSKKLTYVHEMFPLLRVWQAHHSRLLYQSWQDSRDAAWDHRRVHEDSPLGKGKSKGRFYIAQRFKLFLSLFIPTPTRLLRESF